MPFTCPEQNDLVLQGEVREVRDALGPLDEREELLVSRVAYVGDRVIHLKEEQSTRGQILGLPDTPCPSTAPTGDRETGGRVRVTYRALHVHVAVGLCLWFNSEFSFQNPPHGHVPAAARRALRLALGPLPAPLPLFLHGWCTGRTQSPRAQGGCGPPKPPLPHGTAGIAMALNPGVIVRADGTEKAELRYAHGTVRVRESVFCRSLW